MNWHESKKIFSNKLWLSWWKKRLANVLPRIKQHSSPGLVFIAHFCPPSPSQRASSEAYDGHFEEVGQIQEAGYTEVRRLRGRLVEKIPDFQAALVVSFRGRLDLKKKSSTCGLSKILFPFKLPGNPCCKSRAPKTDRLQSGVMGPLLRHIDAHLSRKSSNNHQQDGPPSPIARDGVLCWVDL